MNDISVILSSAIRLTAPLAFAGAGEYVAERGGSLIISIEGMMLSGAFFGILGSSVFGNPVLGLMCGVLGGLAVAMLHANLSYRLDANTLVVGLTPNILALGLTRFLLETIDITPHRPGPVQVPLLHALPIHVGPLFVTLCPTHLLLSPFPISLRKTAR